MRDERKTPNGALRIRVPLCIRVLLRTFGGASGAKLVQ